MKQSTNFQFKSLNLIGSLSFIFSLFLFSQSLQAQTLTFNNAVPTDLTVCQPGKTFTVSFTNVSGSALNNLQISVQFPTGVKYVPASLTNVGGGSVSESNVSNTGHVYFSAGSLAANATLSFSLTAEAQYAAYTAVLAGSLFRNTVNVSYTGGATSNQTSYYNILYPALTITSVSPMTGTVYSGQTFTRTVTIVNGGFGATSSVVLKDTHNSNLQITATSKGVLNGAGSEITLSAADFMTTGDGDGIFEKNESITFMETILAAGCTSASSTLQAFWGCNGSQSGSNSSNPNTTITLYAPSLAVATTPSFNTCMDGSAMEQRIRFTNTGTGPAKTLVLTISPTSSDVYTGIDASSVKYTVNGGSLTPITPASTTPAAAYACLSGKVGGFTINLPNMQPGDVINVYWNNYTCTTAVCTAMKLVGWKYSATYTNNCNSQNYSKTGTGQAEKSKSSAVFFESPSDLQNGEVGKFNFILSSMSFDLPSGTNPRFEAEFDIPNGLVWSGNSADLKYISGADVWQPSSVTYNPSTKKLTAAYPYPIPFTLTRSEFQLNLALDCSVPNANGNATVGMQLFYVMNSSCASPYRLPLTCKAEPVTYLHCPGDCTAGLDFQSFKIERTSFGKPDNNLDGLADATGSLDQSKIKKNRVMVSDTFKTVFNGKIKTSAQYPSWQFGYAKSIIPNGNRITVLSASVKITDQSTGEVLICSSIPFTQSLSGTVRTVTYNFSPATLAIGGCPIFTGFVLENNDLVEVVANYKVTGNIGAAIQQVMIQNDFYVSPTATGTAFQCNDWNGNFTMIGYNFINSKSETTNVKTCTQVIEQSFYLGIGDCCTNYAGGDYFPFEYRNWAKVKEMTITIPAGYAIVGANMKHYRTQYTNRTVLETAGGLTPVSNSGLSYVYDLGAQFSDQGGTLNPGDDGFNGTVYVEVRPSCSVVPENTSKQVAWQFKFKENAVLGGNVTAAYTSPADILKYKRGLVEATAAIQTVEGTASTVSWDVTIKNNGTGDAPYSWVFPLSPNGALTVTEVKNLTTSAVLTPVNGFYRLGNLNASQSGSYRFTASYNSCAVSELKLITGYDCEGYPSNMGSFSCSKAEYSMYVEPQPSELQVRVSSAFDPAAPCGNIAEVELEMISSKIAAIKDLVVQIQIPANQSITLVPGSLKKLYPSNTTYQTMPNPALIGDTYTITGNDIDAGIGQKGLNGITNVATNTIKLKFNVLMNEDYEPGDFIRFDMAAKRNCGDPLPTLALAFDPNAAFGKTGNIGLASTGDNWAASWADYDGDGHMDLFVTTYDHLAANELFHNNGNGTFTKITTGAIATDKASSLAATWGDYDNDGDLDVFVANNIGYKNFLYRNEGSGNFTRIYDDPIVNDLGYAHGASWADYDKDGYLDLFVASFFSTGFNQLYHNNGDGTFTRAGNNAVATEAATSVTGVWGDYDNDGWPDLFVANTNHENNSLYKNLGNGNFEKITTGAIVNDGGNSVGASWGDYDNDLDLDLFVANAGNQNNFLYQNNGDGTFTKITTGPVVNSGGHSHGSAWADYDNDGWLDLFVANDQDQDNFLYRNNGDGTFSSIDNDITQAGGKSFGCAWADYDNDGDPDLFVANRGGQDNFLFKNSRGQCQSKSMIKLVGSNSNRSAIGAKIYVKANIMGQDVWQMREITAQSGGGIGGQNELKTIFGLGDAISIDSIIIKWPSGFVQKLANQPVDQLDLIVESNASEVCGKVYFDANNNCLKDAGEPGIANAKIVLQPGDHTVYTDAQGNYSVHVPSGQYGIQEFPGENWTPQCPNTSGTRAVTVEGLGNRYCGNDFGNSAQCSLPDLSAKVVSTAHRIGFKNLMVINYDNLGATAATQAVLTVTLDPNMTPVESSAPWAAREGNHLVWNDALMQPGEKNSIYLIYEVNAETPVETALQIQTSINCQEGDCETNDNSFTEMSMAVGAFDPNDILVSPEGGVKTDEWLTYKIRFQNVGNAPVSFVRVEDQLPAGLELSTFEIGTVSHNYQFQSDGRKLIWTFPNINLPDSVHNEPQSHGFIVFRIKPKATLLPGDEIVNSAKIYFDNLEGIQTNEVTNFIQTRNTAGGGKFQSLDLFPNPTSGMVTVQFAGLPPPGDNLTLASLIVYDMHGRPVLEKNEIGSSRTELDLRELPDGYYRLKALDNRGHPYFGKVVLF